MSQLDIFTTAMRLIVAPWVTGVIVIGVLVVGLVLLRQMRRSLDAVRPKLARFAEYVDGIRGPEDFVARYSEIDAELSEYPMVGAEWKNFRETFILPEGADTRIRTSRRAREYFGFDALLAPHLALRKYAAVPGIMTGLGLLGTFVGLAAGVHLASQGLGSNDAKQVEEALRNLLHGASLAFWKSVAAIGMSVVFVWVEKRELHALERECDAIASKIDACVDNVTPEQLAAEAARIQRRQADVLESFGTDLAVTLASAISQAMNTDVTPALSSRIASEIDQRLSVSLGAKLLDMKTAFAQFTAEASKAQASSAAAIADQVKDTLTGATETQMQGIAQTFGRLNQTLEKMTLTLQQEQDSLRNLVEVLNKDLRSTLSDLSGRLAQDTASAVNAMRDSTVGAGKRLAEDLSEAGKSTSRVLEVSAIRLEHAVEGLAAFAAAHEMQMKRQHEIAQSATAMLERFRTAGAELAKTVQPIEGAAAALETTALNFQQGVQAMLELKEGLAATAESVTESQEAGRRAWVQYQERFESLDASVANVFERLNAGLNQYSQKVNDHVNGMDKAMSSAITLLSGAIKELADVVEDAQLGGGE